MSHEAESEKLLLGAVLDAPTPADALKLLDAAGLAAHDFTDGPLRFAWELAKRRADRNQTVDPVAIWTAGQIVSVFDADDLVWLQTLATRNTLAPEKFRELADGLRRRARQRDVVTHLQELAHQASSTDFHPATLAGRLEQLMARLDRDFTTTRTAELDPLEVLDDWNRRGREGRGMLVPTGLPALDEAIGGLPPNLVILGGPPGIGKSAAAASAILEQLDRGLKVGFVGLEDGHKWITRRRLALELGIPVREIGSRRMTEDEATKSAEVAERLSKLLRNLYVFRWGSATADDICLAVLGWLLDGVQVVWIDNATEINHHRPGDRSDHRVQVIRSAQRLRDFFVRYQVPGVLLAHTTQEYEDKRANQPPRQTDIAEGAIFSRVTRLFLGCWQKKWDREELRITVGKANEAETGATIGYRRHLTQALLDVSSGRLIDVRKEAKEERDVEQARSDERNALRAEERRKLREQIRAAAKPEPKPAPPAEPEPQAALDLGPKP